MALKRPVDPALARRLRSLQINRHLATLTAGHFALDLYAGALPLLFPLLIARFELNLASVGLMTFAFYATASLSQPIFGLIGDRFGYRLAGLAVMWTAAAFGLIGLAPTYALALLAGALAGLGSGAFHPLGAMAVGAIEPLRRRSTRMSVFISAGTLGIAIGPLVAAAAVAAYGLGGTLPMVVPGVVVGAFIVVRLRRGAHHAQADVVSGPAGLPIRVVGSLVVLMMCRSWIEMVFVTFTPTWYARMGYEASFYAPLTTVMIVGNVAGILVLGAVAERIGARNVVLATLLLTAPAAVLFGLLPGQIGFLTAALIGFVGASTGPILIVSAQRLMRARAGLASGLILGIGSIVGSIGVPITGAIADQVGLANAFMLQALVALAVVPVALRLQLGSHDGRRDSETDA